MSKKPAIAFLGLGLMGAPMASRLLNAGYHVTVWNRSSGKAKPLAASGAAVAASPAEAVCEADIVITMLVDGQAVTDVLLSSSVLEALTSGTVVIDMSSIPPEVAQYHADSLSKVGAAHLDAPVSGGVPGATDGSLAIMVGGAADVFADVRSILEVLGQPVLVGPHGTGQLVKLANQVIVGVTIDALAEALLLVERGGADPAKAREALFGGFADSRILRYHGDRMISRNWSPGGPMRLQVKDLDTALAEADRLCLDLPVVRCAADVFRVGASSGLADHDHSAVFLELARRNAGKPKVRAERGLPAGSNACEFSGRGEKAMMRDEIERKITETLARFETDFRDAEKVLEHVHDDVEWQIEGTTAYSKKRNKAEMTEMLDAFPAFTDTGLRIVPTGFVIEGNKAAVQAESTMKPKTGAEYTNRYHFFFEFRDGKIIRVNEYMDTASAAATFG